MKQLLLIYAVVALVGCGEKDSPEPQTKAKGTPKAADKKPLTEEQSARHAKVVEAWIRKAAKKPTGELTKADLEKVRSLSLEGNQLTDVKGLEKLTWLKELRLYDNKLTSVKGLEKLTQLKVLWLYGNKLTDVKSLEKLTELRELYLGNNQLTSVKGLEKLTQLTRLSLADNQLTDVKGLEKLTQFLTLSLQWNPDLTKAQIDELKKALPKCRIYSSPKK